MIRVLHIVMGMDRGGIETLIMNIYRKVDRSKIQFDFLVHTKDRKSYDEEIEALGGRIYSVSARSEGILKNRRELIDFFSNHTEYKVVHQHVSSLTYIEPLKVAKKFNIPIRIIHGHSTQQGGHKIHKLIHYFNQLSIDKYATHLFACSNNAAKWMYSSYGLGNREYNIINNGIDPELFTYNFEIRERVRKEFRLSNKFVVGHIGRFSIPKNHEFILEVFHEIKKLEKNAILLLVGDGKLKNQIADKIDSKGISDSVIFTGIRSDTSALLNAMDIFLFPSLYEGLGIAAIEAQATGLKCFVSTKVPEEVAITNNISRIPLNKTALDWAKEILKLKNGYIRKSETQQVRAKGYDINGVALWLQELYLELCS